VIRRMEEGGGNDDVMMRRWSSRIYCHAPEGSAALPSPHQGEGKRVRARVCRG